MYYFLIPVYNEELNIKDLSHSLRNSLGSSEKHYIFVDDCSNDRTIEKVRAFFMDGTYTIITKKKNFGPGHSFNIGFEHILKMDITDGDRIITLEADNTSDTGLLDKMTAISDLGYGIVLASPYAQGGGFEKTSLWRKVLSFIANTVLRFFFDIKVLTLSSFYRIYRPSVLKKIKEKYGKIIEENGFICMVEVLIKAIRTDASLIEVPMVLKSDKRKDASKMKIFRTMLNYAEFLFRNLFRK